MTQTALEKFKVEGNIYQLWIFSHRDEGNANQIWTIRNENRLEESTFRDSLTGQGEIAL